MGNNKPQLRIITCRGFGHHFTATANYTAWYRAYMIQLRLRFICHLCLFWRSTGFTSIWSKIKIKEYYSLCIYETKSGNIPFFNINNSFPHTQSHETMLILIKTRRTCFILLNRTQVLTFQIHLLLSDHYRIFLLLSLVNQSVVTLKEELPAFQMFYEMCRLCVFLFCWCSVDVADVYSQIKLVI